MNNKEQLIEQHIKEYYSRLKHIDELAQQAAAAEHEEHYDEWSELKAKRDKLAKCLGQLEHTEPREVIEAAGPMAVWDMVAQQLENLVARITK